MTEIQLPEWVAHNVLREQMSEEVDRHTHSVLGFARLLKEYDEQLSLVMVKEKASAPGLVPGCLHIKRTNPGAPDSYMPLTTRDGKFREPVSTDIDRLAQRDLWRTTNLMRHREQEQKQNDKAEALFREQSRDELAANFKVAKRVAGDGGLEKRLWGKR